MAGDDSERWQAPESAAGLRLDTFLAEHFSLSRNQIARWIRDGRVQVNGGAAKPATRLDGGDRLECRPDRDPPAGQIEPEAGPLVIVWQDDHLAVLEKPPGVVVHPGAGREPGTLAHRVLAAYPETASVGGPGRPGIVHRLDRGTSGLLVIARSQAAYQALSTAFAERRIEKGYLGVVYGEPRQAEGRLEAPIGRHRTRRKEMAEVPDGRPARTDYTTLASAAGISLLALVLGTGRTHQIRVHLKGLGHPLVGDPVYGEARWKGLERRTRAALADFPRPALHAWRLAFAHPVSDERLEFAAPPPDDLRELWRHVTELEFPALPEAD